VLKRSAARLAASRTRLRGVAHCVILDASRFRSLQMASPRVIKKYPNRRLYDTEISSYITIEDVRQLIVDGEEFEVRDARSGDDLTRQVLLQIIAEHEQDGEPLLSTQLLSHIIRFYGDSMQGFMGTYLEKSMQVFLDQQQQFRAQMGGLLGQTPWTLMNQLTERNLQMWKDFQQNLSGTMGTPTARKGETQK
jgi:polyhydroxyalkanoate synthesis repressor PhaR